VKPSGEPSHAPEWRWPAFPEINVNSRHPVMAVVRRSDTRENQMTDESAIRQLQQAWFRATMAEDVTTISDLMTADAIFLTTARSPFGRHEFIESFNAMKEQVALSCKGEYEEVVVAGDIAYARARLEIEVTPKNGGSPKHMSGNALSVFRRCADGKWRLCRDANLLAPSAE
jgi:uncharacterized protein (TIGR02246 family)